MIKPLRLMIFLIAFALVFTAVSCGKGAEEKASLPEEISVGGASLEMGLSVDGWRNIEKPQATFGVEEDFFYRFDNGETFGAVLLLVKVTSLLDDKVIARVEHAIEPDEFIFLDSAWIDTPGTYMLSVEVAGRLRASRLVTIAE